MKNRKKRGKVFFAIGILAVVAVATSLVVSSCDRHGFEMDKNPERMKELVNWKVNDVLDDIDADDTQRRQILASVNKLVDEGMAMRGDKDQHKQVVHAELSKDQPDGEKLHAMLDEKIEKVRLFAHKALDTVLDTHAILTPEQRDELMDAIDEHHENHGRHEKADLSNKPFK